jgi:hypothetical protein
MLRTKLAAIVVAAAFGLTDLIVPVSALPLNGNIPEVAKSGPNLVLVHQGKKGHKHVKKKWVYSGSKHGKRYRAKRTGYAYYYGGWWYPRPWWRTDPGLFICIGC